MDSYLNLTIGTDPTLWWLENLDYGVVAAELSQDGPVVLDVAHPLRGRLVLCVPCAPSVTLFRPPVTVGTHPTDIAKPPPPLLYLPTVTGATQDEPGYALDLGTDLGALEQGIVAAMRDGSRLPVHATDGLTSGLLVLNGATLAFAVICPATA